MGYTARRTRCFGRVWLRSQHQQNGTDGKIRTLMLMVMLVVYATNSENTYTVLWSLC
jgi:hypothetical protein